MIKGVFYPKLDNVNMVEAVLDAENIGVIWRSRWMGESHPFHVGGNGVAKVRIGMREGRIEIKTIFKNGLTDALIFWSVIIGDTDESERGS